MLAHSAVKMLSGRRFTVIRSLTQDREKETAKHNVLSLIQRLVSSGGKIVEKREHTKKQENEK